LVWNHGDRDLIGIFVHRAGRGIDPEPDKTSEHNISRGHCFLFEAIIPEPGK